MGEIADLVKNIQRAQQVSRRKAARKARIKQQKLNHQRRTTQ